MAFKKTLAISALVTIACLVVRAAPAAAGKVRVRSSAELKQVLLQAQPGLTVLVAPGIYRGGLHIDGLKGKAGSPIIIRAEDETRRPVFEGGPACLHLSNTAHLEINGLEFRKARANGINIDDGGSYVTPSHHIVLSNLYVHDIGPRGNCDGIKLSGVDHFRIYNCRIERWGSAGQGIDMVGCHYGVIERCSLQFEDTKGAGIQAKGGSGEIRIRCCRFEHAGSRAVNLGGSTGLQFFRPPLSGRKQHAEARSLTVEGCTFLGSLAAIAFVGVDGATVAFNTIYRPKRWVLRILQETRAPGFVPSRRGIFRNNLVVFRSDEVKTTVNIGPGTSPETFTFSHNWWYCIDRPNRSAPSLPTAERGGVVGVDPKLRNPEKGDFTPVGKDSARGVGAHGFRLKK